MKKQSIIDEKHISNEELSIIINRAYDSKSDIYTINDNNVIIDNYESELSFVYDDNNYLIKTIDSIFISEICRNDSYSDILLIYVTSDDIVEREYILNNGRISDNKTVIICKNEEMLELLKSNIIKLGYTQSNNSYKRVLFKK